MTAAVYLLLYGVMVTWLAPPLLSRLTRGGLNPRLGVAVWLTAILGVLAAWSVAVVLTVVHGVRGLPESPVIVVCLELLGIPEQVATPSVEGTVLLIAAAVLLWTVVGVRAGRAVRGLWASSREHAQAARLIGEPTDRPDVFVLNAERPAAYCVAGRPNAIVVTSAAVERLTGSQLDAVLAHENAHITGRHHQLLMVLRALAATLPRLPLFPRAADAVGELLEMCADDLAARRHGGRTLVAGMVKLAGPVAPAGLGVAASAITRRANRLLIPAHPGSLRCHRATAWATIAVTVAAPVVVNLICRH